VVDTGLAIQLEDRKSHASISLFYSQVWGFQMIYKSVTLPVLKIRSMLLETPHGKIQAKKWSRVPFSVPDFDILRDCTQSLSDLSLD